MANAGTNDTSITLGHFIDDLKFSGSKKEPNNEKIKLILRDPNLDSTARKVESVMSFVDWDTKVDFDPNKSFQNFFFIESMGPKNSILYAELVRLRRVSEQAFSILDYVFGNSESDSVDTSIEIIRTLLGLKKEAKPSLITKTLDRALKVITKHTRLDVKFQSIKDGKYLVGYRLFPSFRPEKADKWVFEGIKFSETKTEENLSYRTAPEIFDTIWKKYPKKTRRGVAQTYFLKAIGLGIDPEEIYTGAMNYIEYVKEHPQEKVIHGFTFFSPKQKLWENYL